MTEFDQDDIAAEITEDICAALQVLRNAGFAVVAFCPTELQGASVGLVEDGMVQAGWSAIDTLKEFGYASPRSL